MEEEEDHLPPQARFLALRQGIASSAPLIDEWMSERDFDMWEIIPRKISESPPLRKYGRRLHISRSDLSISLRKMASYLLMKHLTLEQLSTGYPQKSM